LRDVAASGREWLVDSDRNSADAWVDYTVYGDKDVKYHETIYVALLPHERIDGLIPVANITIRGSAMKYCGRKPTEGMRYADKDGSEIIAYTYDRCATLTRKAVAPNNALERERGW
jgi:hypothetical protein